MEETAADFAVASITTGPHPMEYYAPRARPPACRPPPRRSRTSPPGRRVRTAGSVIVRQRPGTARGLLFLTPGGRDRHEPGGRHAGPAQEAPSHDRLLLRPDRPRASCRRRTARYPSRRTGSGPSTAWSGSRATTSGRATGLSAPECPAGTARACGSAVRAAAPGRVSRSGDRRRSEGPTPPSALPFRSPRSRPGRPPGVSSRAGSAPAGDRVQFEGDQESELAIAPAGVRMGRQRPGDVVAPRQEVAVLEVGAAEVFRALGGGRTDHCGSARKSELVAARGVIGGRARATPGSSRSPPPDGPRRRPRSGPLRRAPSVSRGSTSRIAR